MKCRTTITEKKLAANRQNSKRSTGPRTERGKNASKFNAVISGLFAKHAVIAVCDGEGCEELFARVLTGLQQEFEPKGPYEGFLVVEIARCMWRLRRARRCEKGSVRSVERQPLNLFKEPEPNKERSAILLKALDEMKKPGILSQDDYSAALPILRRFGMARAEQDPSPPQPDIDDQHSDIDRSVQTIDRWHKQLMISVIDVYVSEWQKELDEDYYSLHALPREAAMNKILRYERAAQKALDWALQRLLESQQRRQKAQMPL